MNQDQIFSIAEGFTIVLWILILYWVGRFIRNRFDHESIQRFFYAGWGVKIAFAVVFAFVYLFVLGGGDINAYWDSATVLNKLFLTNPSGYFQELVHTDRILGVTHHFNQDTGYPPGWIWREPEAWNAAKILSVFSIITFNGFWATTLLVASVVFFSSWVMVYRIITHEEINANAVLFAFLFFPSVTFWCSGISKDSQVYTLSLLLMYQLFRWLIWDPKRTVIRFLIIIGISILLFGLRQFVALAIIAPFFLAIAARYANRWANRPLILLLFRVFVYTSLVFAFFVVANLDRTQVLIQEAQITQSDFSVNPIYTGAKYEINQSDGSILGLILSLPEAVFIALYRPFITENLGYNFIVNGVESLGLLLFTGVFFLNRNLIGNLRYLIKSEFTIYMLTFVLLTAFMAGYTSILFGVLVRIRALALPFFFLLLTIRKPQLKNLI